MKSQLKTLTSLFMIVFITSCNKEKINTPIAVAEVNTSHLLSDSIYIGAEYGGGIIFWIDDTGEHGLIAAKENIGVTQWAANPTIVTGANKKVIGTGPANTKKIVTALGDTGTYAGLLCTNYRTQGYGDWFLPSIGELQQLMIHKDLIGGFLPDNFLLYASSTEGENHTNLALGIIYTNSQSLALTRKDNNFNVRPVRKF